MLMSSSRPTNGEMKLAPALAARSAWLAENPAGFQPVPGHRHLDDDVVGELGEEPALFQHAGEIGRDDFGRHRTGHDLANFLQDVGIGPVGLQYERGIGGHAVDQTGFRKIADFRNVGGIDEEFHGVLFLRRGRGVHRAPGTHLQAGSR
jgi:hypothetical protein